MGMRRIYHATNAGLLGSGERSFSLSSRRLRGFVQRPLLPRPHVTVKIHELGLEKETFTLRLQKYGKAILVKKASKQH